MTKAHTTSAAAPGTARPSKEERHAAQRGKIIAAAKRCVVQRGFHAAGMSQIAATAGMSVGQIYRYFASKESIVEAIVALIVLRKLEWMGEPHGRLMDPDQMADSIASAHEDDADDRILLIEVTAEATRNVEVAAIVKDADRQLHRRAEQAVALRFPDMARKDVVARVELIAVLAEGVAFRWVTDQLADRKTLRALFRAVLQQVFGEDGRSGVVGKR